jgi:hypothetical protein
MPKNKVSDPITDQEMAFARLLLSGAMTDRQAAETAGLNPDSAAYIKSKPHVRAYMLEHRAAVEQQLVQQEAEGLRRFSLDREQVLARLWEIANLSPEMTRNSISGQVKALSMIIAMENFIPDRKAVSSEKNSPTAPAKPQIYKAAWLEKQQATTMDPPPSPAAQEDLPACPARPGQPWGQPGSVPQDPGPSHSSTSETTPPALYAPAPIFSFVPDARLPLSLYRRTPLPAAAEL